MELYIDTVVLDDIAKACETGLIKGITTTPTFFARDGFKDPIQFYKKMREIFDGDLQVEALGTDTDEIKASIDEILGAGLNNLTFKTPVNWHGLKAVKTYSKEHKFNVHLVYNVNQAILAADCGAAVVCPLMGRFDDYGGESYELLCSIKEALVKNGYDTKVMASSIRHPKHVEMAFQVPADIVTIPPKVFWNLLKSPYTQDGISKFEADLKDVSLK